MSSLRPYFRFILFTSTLVAILLCHSQAHASGMYQLTDLGVAPAVYGVPIINASGQVVQDPSGASLMKAGSYSIASAPSQTPGNNMVTTLYQNGSVIATLDTVLGNPTYDQINGYAVNKSGMVVGSEQDGQLPGPLGVAYYYTPTGGMHAIPQLYPSSKALNAALSVNDAGVIVGASTGPSGYYDSIRTAYLSNGQTSWDLNTLIAPGSGLTLTSATYISDSDLIAGFGVDGKGQEHIVLLTPMATPEPSVLMILGLGIVALGVRKVSRGAKKATREQKPR